VQPPRIEWTVDQVSETYAQKRANTSDPTTLLMIDETDRLKTAGLEQVRDIFDQGGVGVVLIGMPGLEKRLSRYPQLYSRVGFVHEFRPLSPDAMRDLFCRQWLPAGIVLPDEGLNDEEVMATIIRITGGNFRLLHRLLTQAARLVEINALSRVTREVVEAARENLVIGTA
jgi:DNA transposition AAA+ family ATPase